MGRWKDSWIVLAALFAAGTARAESTCEVALSLAGKRAEMTIDSGTPCLLVATPNLFPATRTRLLLDAQDGRHLEIEWDALISTRLARSVLLPSRGPGEKDVWQVSVWSEPAPFGSRSVATGEHVSHAEPVDLGWVFVPQANTVDGDSLILHAPDPTAQSPYEVQAYVAIRLQGKQLDVFAPDAEEGEEIGFVGAPGGAVRGSALRGFPIVDGLSVGTDAVEALAYAVATKAQIGTLEHARDRLVRAVCEQDSVGALLPVTCSALRTLRVEQLSAAGQTMKNALLDDLAGKLAEEITADFGSTGQSLGRVLLRAVAHAASASDRQRWEPRSVMLSLLSLEPEKAGDLQVAVEILRTCALLEACRTEEVVAMVREPRRWLTENQLVELKLFARYAVGDPLVDNQVQLDRDEIARFVERGMKVLRPDPGMNERDQLRLLARMVAQGLRWSPKEGADEARVKELRIRADRLERLCLAVLDDDMRAATFHLVDLLMPGPKSVAGKKGRTKEEKEKEREEEKTRSASEDSAQHVARVARLVSTMATLEADLAEAQRLDGESERRKARRDAIIRASGGWTDRTDREGQIVLSLGGAVALGADSRIGDGVHQYTYLPLGVGADLVRGRGPGFQVTATALDVGGWLSVDEDGLAVQADRDAGNSARWGAILAPAASVGITGGARGTPAFLALQGGYDPSLQQLWGGVRIGVWAPLLDLN